MLSWEPGPKPFDGVWAEHWYGTVHESDGLHAAQVKPLPDVGAHRALLDEVLPAYEAMAAKALA